METPKAPDTPGDDERAAIDACVAALEAARHGGDHRAIVRSTEALDRATASFAARRMDRGVARALTGRSVDALT